MRPVDQKGSQPLPQLALKPTAFLILGQTRITEELSRMAALLGFEPTICTPSLDLMQVDPGAFVIVASHHHKDDAFISHALRNNAPYVALVASEKRASLIPNDSEHYFAPAGLSLPSETPSQIAFSIICEILFCQGRFHENCA